MSKASFEKVVKLDNSVTKVLCANKLYELIVKEGETLTVTLPAPTEGTTIHFTMPNVVKKFTVKHRPKHPYRPHVDLIHKPWEFTRIEHFNDLSIPIIYRAEYNRYGELIWVKYYEDSDTCIDPIDSEFYNARELVREYVERDNDDKLELICIEDIEV